MEEIKATECQTWKIENNGMFTSLYLNGIQVKNLKSVEFKHRVNELGRAELPTLRIEIFTAKELTEDFNQDEAIRSATLENKFYKYFQK